MATGFKQATVRAADVPATQTDFPVYVDLARMGITLLSEASSVRVYSDFAKTVELAREIVSLSEMHVKVSSLTNTFVIYVDWDDVRADYAVGATFGRNAVWSTYEFVSHLIGTDDSAGNHNLTANGGVTLGGAGGQIGSGTDFDGTNDTATHTGTTLGAKSTFAIQFWANPDSVSSRAGIVMNTNGINAAGDSFGVEMANSLSGELYFRAQLGANFHSLSSGSGTLTTGAWQKITATRSSNVASIYRNGTSAATTSGFGTGTTNNIAMFGIGAFGIGAFLYFNGRIDEVRIPNFNITANWETTEYNNQNAESTFWGTWTNASAPVVTRPDNRMYFI